MLKPVHLLQEAQSSAPEGEGRNQEPAKVSSREMLSAGKEAAARVMKVRGTSLVQDGRTSPRSPKTSAPQK